MAVSLNPMRRAALLAMAAGMITGLVACDGQSLPGAARPSFKSVDITGAEYARELALPDTEGKVRTLAEFKGKLVVVFFGYTQCPDVCPTPMTELAEVKRQLGPDGSRVVGVFVSVDPVRDTPELLKAYMANFGPDMIGLRGTPEQTQALAKHFKIFYARCRARPPPATRWTTLRAPTSSTPRAGCGCSPAMAAAPRCWLTT